MDRKIAKAEKRFWLIRSYDGVTPVFQYKLSVGALSEREMTALLQRLSARDLTPEEVVCASLRRSAKNYRPLLEVRAEPRVRVILSVGENPHYVASVHTESEIKDIEARNGGIPVLGGRWQS